MERVSVTVERSEHVRLVLEANDTWSARGPAFYGYGETPTEALEDYRKKLAAETTAIMDRVQVWQRQGFLSMERPSTSTG